MATSVQRRAAIEQQQREEHDRDCTAESLITAQLDAQRRGDALAGYSPWYVGEGKRGGYVFCEKHNLYTLIEWDTPSPRVEGET